ncbi:MAG TPA: DUF4252 domain-containing protein [Steroidobacteraceae bacterium]|nr:DUF4252 domain-containing protein [Steroidobacteraceae bacterium]
MRHSSIKLTLGAIPVWILLALPVASLAQAGRVELPSFDGLEKKAVNSVTISLDLSLLKLVAQAMDNSQDDQAVKGVLSGLQGIYVRSFQFATDHAYPQSDVDRVRQQIEAAGWSKLVSVHNSQQNQDVLICVRQEGKRIDGLVVFATNPREFTIVNLVGSVDLRQLSQLQGKLGVPNLHLGQKPAGS